LVELKPRGFIKSVYRIFVSKILEIEEGVLAGLSRLDTRMYNTLAVAREFLDKIQVVETTDCHPTWKTTKFCGIPAKEGGTLTSFRGNEFHPFSELFRYLFGTPPSFDH
jgi:hypothetical protein